MQRMRLRTYEPTTITHHPQAELSITKHLCSKSTTSLVLVLVLVLVGVGWDLGFGI